jgi:hypothetical protein
MSTTNLTQKEAFLQFLQNSDIERLEEILDDSITYFGASINWYDLKNLFCQLKWQISI